MLNDVFYLILNMSFASCFVIAVLLFIRLFKPLPRRFVYPLWALAFFRLIMPFTLPTSWSLFNLTGGLVKRLITIETITPGMAFVPESKQLYMMNFMGAANTYTPITYRTESLRQIFYTGSTIWAIVAVAALLSACFLYALTYSELKKAIPVKGNIYFSDMLLSPMLVGVFRPKMIFPVGFDPDSPEGKMIQAHENIHRKRLDNLWRALAIGIACLHWFNPLVWLMLKVFFTDMELSCDEAVLRRGKFNQEERGLYASTLLHFAEDKRFLISSSFGRSNVKVRIVNVLHYKRMTVIGAIVSAVFLLAIALVLITNPSLRG